MLASLAAQNLSAIDLNFSKLFPDTDGFSPDDVINWVQRALHFSSIRLMKSSLAELGAQKKLSLADFEQALQDFTPGSLRGTKLTQSETKWSDIGGIVSYMLCVDYNCLGLQQTRNILRETLDWPTRYSRVFRSCPLRLRSGSEFFSCDDVTLYDMVVFCFLDILGVVKLTSLPLLHENAV